MARMTLLARYVAAWVLDLEKAVLPRHRRDGLLFVDIQVMLVGVRVPSPKDFLTAAGLKGEITARRNGGRKGLDKLAKLVVLIQRIA